MLLRNMSSIWMGTIWMWSDRILCCWKCGMGAECLLGTGMVRNGSLRMWPGGTMLLVWIGRGSMFPKLTAARHWFVKPSANKTAKTTGKKTSESLTRIVVLLNLKAVSLCSWIRKNSAGFSLPG